MIDYLIFYQTIKFGLKRSYILKVMNSLIYMDLKENFQFFWIFLDLFWVYLNLKT